MTFRAKLREVVAAAPINPPDLAGALVEADYIVHPLKLVEGTHAALVTKQRGSLADPWGRGITSVVKARRAWADNPKALIGVTRGDARAVVNPATGKLENLRQRVMYANLRSTPFSSKQLDVDTMPLPRPPSVADALAALRVALAEKAQRQGDVDGRRRAVEVIEQRRSNAEHDLVKERKRFGDAAADAVAQGKEIPGLPRVRLAIRKHEAEIANCHAALPLAIEQLERAQTKLAEHSPGFARAALDLDAALTSAALQAAVQAISMLADPLAELVAVSLIREELLGEHFAFDRRCHAPIGARQIAKGFVEVVPTVLRTEALTIESIEGRAGEIATAHLTTLEAATVEQN
jgi:hypothetical protein